MIGASKKRPSCAKASIAGIAASVSLRVSPSSEPLRYAFSRPVKSGWKPAPSSSSAEMRPSTSIVPDVGFAVPAMSLRSVDFPDPFAPTTPKHCPRSTAKLTSFSAWTTSEDEVWRRMSSLSVGARPVRRR